MVCCRISNKKGIDHKHGISNVSKTISKKAKSTCGFDVKEGSDVCLRCRMYLYDEIRKNVTPIVAENSNEESVQNDAIESIDEEDLNYRNEGCSDEEVEFADESKIEVLNLFLQQIDRSPVRSIHKSSLYKGNEKYNKIIENVGQIMGVKANPTVQDSKDSLYLQEILSQMKEVLQKTQSRNDKIKILTLLPKSWNISKIMHEFGVPYYMAAQIKSVSIKSILHKTGTLFSFM